MINKNWTTKVKTKMGHLPKNSEHILVGFPLAVHYLEVMGCENEYFLLLEKVS